MKKLLHSLLPALLGIGLLTTTTGCKTIARENIISSINTGIGVTVAENPKTEMYEVKIGYIRSQFYSVPTGKTVEDDCTNGAHHSNKADLTPQVVSGIRMESGIEQLLVGLKVSESFAVGSDAVNSQAAVAMYIANAQSEGRAEAASAAVKGTVFEEDDNSAAIAAWLDADAGNKKKLRDWLKAKSPGTLITPFVSTRKYKDLRQQAVSDATLAIPKP